RLRHTPNGSLRRSLSRRRQEAPVLAPRHLGLVHQEPFDRGGVTRTLRRLALRVVASHLKRAAGNANHDGAVLLAPVLLAPLWIPPERAQRARRLGGPLEESEGYGRPAPLLDPCYGMRFAARGITNDHAARTRANGTEDHRPLRRRPPHEPTV